MRTDGWMAACIGLFLFAAAPGETTDLSESHREKCAGLIEIWRTERKALGIVLPQNL